MLINTYSIVQSPTQWTVVAYNNVVALQWSVHVHCSIGEFACHIMPPPVTRRMTTSADDSFETFVRSTLMEIKEGQGKLTEKLEHLEESINFEAQRVTEVVNKAEKTQKRVEKVEQAVANHETILTRMTEADNKLERMSRRNNIRIVGLKEKTEEKPMELVSKLLQEKFGMEVEIERAHRNGYKRDAPSTSRHMLVKLLRFQDKRQILICQRKKLEGCDIYVTDDHTKADLEEKKKHSGEVKFLYERGTKLHFSAGKWRTREGKLAPFYDKK